MTGGRERERERERNPPWAGSSVQSYQDYGGEAPSGGEHALPFLLSESNQTQKIIYFFWRACLLNL